jgi:hypothetical protein
MPRVDSKAREVERWSLTSAGEESVQNRENHGSFDIHHSKCAEDENRGEIYGRHDNVESADAPHEQVRNDTTDSTRTVQNSNLQNSDVR